MPEGSSSAAPVMSPGPTAPRMRRSLWGGLPVSGAPDVEILGSPAARTGEAGVSLISRAMSDLPASDRHAVGEALETSHVADDAFGGPTLKGVLDVAAHRDQAVDGRDLDAPLGDAWV